MEKIKRMLSVFVRLSLDTHLWCFSIIGGSLILCLSFFVGPVEKQLTGVYENPKPEYESANRVIEYSSIFGNLSLNNIEDVDEISEIISEADETEIEGFDSVEEAIEASGVLDIKNVNEIKVSSSVEGNLPTGVDSEAVSEEDVINVSEEHVDCVRVYTDYTLEEIDLLNRLIQCEAQTEDLKGRVLIANVVLNRVESGIWGDSISSVIKAKGQFDPVESGAVYVTIPDDMTKEAVLIALNGADVSDGALYFQKSAQKEWGKKTFLFRYGSHSFYK